MRARSHLTTRDWRILELLDEHRVLTAPQLCDLAFHHPTTARHRLQVLYRLKVVNRFRPPPERLGGGSAPFHYVLDRYGALLLTQQRAVADDHLHDDSLFAELGRARLERRLAWLNPDYLLAIATSQRLRHQVAVNAFFCALVRAARASDGRRELAEWQGERRARRHSAAYEHVCVRPDGYAVWCEDGDQLPFFFELDRGTEALDRLADKLDGYAQAEEAHQQPTWILVSLPSQQRERHAHQAMLTSAARTCRWPPPTAASQKPPAAPTRRSGGPCATPAPSRGADGWSSLPPCRSLPSRCTAPRRSAAPAPRKPPAGCGRPPTTSAGSPNARPSRKPPPARPGSRPNRPRSPPGRPAPVDGGCSADDRQLLDRCPNAPTNPGGGVSHVRAAVTFGQARARAATPLTGIGGMDVFATRGTPSSAASARARPPAGAVALVPVAVATIRATAAPRRTPRRPPTHSQRRDGARTRQSARGIRGRNLGGSPWDLPSSYTLRTRV
jgi:hypothetical protein